MLTDEKVDLFQRVRQGNLTGTIIDVKKYDDSPESLYSSRVIVSWDSLKEPSNWIPASSLESLQIFDEIDEAYNAPSRRQIKC